MVNALIIISVILMSAFVAGRLYRSELVTKTRINAESTEIWKLLSDFKQYSQWNPFVTSVEGDVIQGLKLDVTISSPSGQSMRFKPELLVVDVDRELRWRGKFIVPGLFDGEHYFIIQTNESGRVEFVQGEIFSGFLAWMLMPFIKEDTEAGFRSMNEALKEIAEANVYTTSQKVS